MATKKKLLIVESPTKAKTINNYLGRSFKVVATVGHIKDLPKTTLGVDVENDFDSKYQVIRGKAKIIKELKAHAKNADHIYIAPDPDREGEAIAAHVYEEINKVVADGTPIQRAVFSEVTKEAIKKAIDAAGEIDFNKVEAQKARRILDRLVGYQISPLLWKSLRRGLSAGRVQSVTVRLVCEREKEILAFNQEEYWSVLAQFTGEKKQSFDAKLFKIDGKDPEIKNEEEALAICKEIEAGSFDVSKIQRKKRSRKPYAPFITSTLQQEASRALRFSAKKTMQIAQQLYEGVQLGKDGMVGLITYMRTDSARTADSAIEAARQHIQESFGETYLPAKPNKYGKAKAAQDAHEAIRPTYPEKYSLEQVTQYLTKDQQKLYGLIYRRFIASQMKPAKFDQTTVDILLDRYQFRANGSVLTFDGFLKVYDVSATNKDLENTKNKDNTKKKKEQRLPELQEQEKLDLTKLEKNQHFTKPPARYNEASLIKALEELGIGRPSTYANIVSTIQDRNYVLKESGKFEPLELGILVNSLLMEFFPDILNTKFTAAMESSLDEIELGETELAKTLGKFYINFEKDLKAAEEGLREALKRDIPCELCKAPMMIKMSRGGSHFLGCSNYPDCKSIKEFTLSADGSIEIREPTEPEISDQKCEKCGKPMVTKTGRFGKFLACSGYPDCKNIVSLKKQEPTVLLCKECQQPMKLYVSPNQNHYFLCPDCKKGFSAVQKNMYQFDKTDQKCEKCGGMMKIRNKRKGGDRFLGCGSFPKCRNLRSFDTGISSGDGGSFLERKMKGKTVYQSSENKKEIIFGGVPIPRACPKCKHPYLVERFSNESQKATESCPKCDYSKDLTLSEVEEKKKD